MECIFCKIANGEIPAKLVFENEHAAAFDDINPVAKVHTLVVTKKHYENLLAVGPEDAETLRGLHEAIRETAKLKGVDASGFRLISNCGADSGQAVPHLHYHIIGGQPLGQKIV